MAVRELSPARCTSASPLVLARRTKLFALSEMRWAALALGLFSAGLLTQLCGAPQWVRWALFLACYATGGWEPGLAGLQALQRRTLDVDLLMVVAAIGAAAIGQIAEGALLIVIFATSGALEALVTARTADSVRGLMGLAPGTATRVGAGGGEETVNAADLRIGDIVLVRPGERISADATVLAGGSEVDQATVTGEPLPVDKSIGDQVFAGTVNGTGALRIRVDRLARDSVVARIATLVEQASQTKARTQLFIEKVEQRYSIGMVAVTLAVFAVPPLWGETLQRALLRAMTFMIVASPCAVVLATMPPLLAAIANAGRHGVLAKSAIVMEQLGTTTRIAFDKTGTLTRGTPELAGIWVYERRFTDDELLRLAAAAEYPSEHPLGAAIVKAAQSRRIRLPTVGEFTAHPGCRVTARVDGHVIAVGSATALLGTAGAAALEASMITAVDFLQGEGYTVVVVCDSHPVGLLAITDQLRPEAAAAISAATKLTGAKPVLLTGDNRATADRLGVQVGIDDVRAGLLPDDKVAAVRQLQAGGARLTVVGDGINDAPALAAAHVGIAMGSARSELTLQTADAVVVRDDLTTIPTVIAMSRRARRIVVANLIVAVTFIAGLVVWDLAFTLPLPLGVARHEGSTIIVGLNGLRLLRHTAWRRAAGTAHR
ncbi:Putative cation transporter P-type ATPase CtpJ [Mycobacterium tuberculosis]|uniref:heavy metal translocating P-type ATPase n=1 Tax=Mycobacterium tuberculosis TaxID=1773 RepID=UPI0003A768FD|nr:heavy metal translocating P-type ATPase [Mycobacterium tuberculosis]AJP77924.1 metal ABC transporter ATPase [Mycobacterium tuberculosis]KBB13105.1 cation transporter P-type ATPase CtpJ [Mycobacterium tuberculosis M1787]KBC71329.1 cation transporter P-type ATPase CtpJ [Mycobacterium tuberculosis M2134]KBU65370.1 cation transporter P-type ATPase CtpJ [Mycobacterium tuberculosis NRITLD54]KCN53017.1 cation transporter P-type ATPase CtpJ [Mycobacterium tuberculosis BTB06-467]